MKTLLAVIAGLVIVFLAATAQAQFAVGFYGPPPVVAPPPVFAAPVVAYYGGPAMAYAPGYYVAAAPAPLYYTVRQRTYWRGPYYRSVLRIRGW